MADKQDNRSEQWLRDYARHRREQHGSAPKMHDATRRLLHGEVQRTWGQTVSAEESSGGWESWLLKFATGTVALGVLALSVWVSFDSGNRVTNRAEDTRSPVKITKVEPAQPSGEHAASDSEDSVPKHDAYSNMRRNFSRQIQVRRDQALTIPKKVAKKSIAAVVPVRSEGREVLENFEVVRNGNVIRVRDKDGSVYEGRVILASATPLISAIGGRSSNGGGGIGGGSNQGGGGNTPPLPGAKLPKIVTTTKSSLNKSAGVSPPPLQPGNGLRPGPRPAAKSNRGTVYNDNFAQPLPLALNKAVIGHNINATREFPLESGYLNFHGCSVWYSLEFENGDFNSKMHGMATIDTRGSSFDTTIGVFIIGNGKLIPVDLDDNRPNASWSQAEIAVKAPAGPNNNKYFIAVDGVNGATGQFRLNARLGTSEEDVKAAERQLAKNRDTHFYFQVAGTNRTSGKPLRFEGFMRNAPAETKAVARVDSPSKRIDSLAATGPLWVQGRARYGGERFLTVDAFTAALTPASALKRKRQKE